MTPQPFLLAWQTYYFVLATAAATLAGLLFVGLSFAVGTLKGDVERSIEAWAQPVLFDYLQVLAIGLLCEMPDMDAPLLGGILLGLAAWRLWVLRGVWRYFQGERPKGYLVAQDWFERICLPGGLIGALGGAGWGFHAGAAWAPRLLAFTCLICLLAGLYDTWSQWVWMAAEKSRQG